MSKIAPHLGRPLQQVGGTADQIVDDNSHGNLQAAADGYDPCRGIVHHDRQDTQAFVYDLIEPRRPVADAAVLKFVLSTPFTGADFVLRSDGVCRLAPQLARRVAKLGMAA